MFVDASDTARCGDTNKSDTAGVKSRAAVLTVFSIALALILALSALILYPTGNVNAAERITVDFCVGSSQGNPRMFTSYGSVGFRFEVPEGYSLERFVLLSCPTWGDQTNAGFTADIYPWQGSYNDSVTGFPLESCVVSQHRDNSSISLPFGYIPAGQYLIHIYGFTDVIGTWEFAGLPDEYAFTWAYYQNGIEEIDYLPGTQMVLIRDDDPHTVLPRTPVPTLEPIVTEEGGESTGGDDIDATDGPSKTRERITEEPGKIDANNGNSGIGGIIAGVAVAAVAVAATIITMGIIVRKDKKASDS